MRALDKYYFLTILNIARNLVGRKYRDSYLGILWTILQPASQITIFAIVMPRIMRVPVENYLPFVISSLLIWQFISTSILVSTGSLIGNAGTISRCLVSKTIFPLADIMQNLYVFFVSFTIGYLFCCILYPSTFHYQVVFLPLIIFLIVLILAPMCIAISFITPYCRDFSDAIAVAMNFIFWATPILYPITVFPEEKRWIFFLNPFYLMIKPVSDLVLYGTLPDATMFLRLAILAAVSICVSYAIYRKLRRNFIFYL